MKGKRQNQTVPGTFSRLKRRKGTWYLLVLNFLLLVSLFAFGLDLFHMIFHLVQNPALWNVEGVPLKLLSKVGIFFIPIFLWMKRQVWLKWVENRGQAFPPKSTAGSAFFVAEATACPLFFLAMTILLPAPALAEKSSRCQHARELLSQSGMARDASENLFGNIKTKPPYGSFPEEMDKITWWGAFQPFEFWASPEFKAVWINPEGQRVEEKKFHPSHCRLAKTSLKGENQPRGQFQPGMWNVLVTCEDYLIDKQSFAVLPTPPASTGPDSSSGPKPQTAMIWAEDEVRKP